MATPAFLRYLPSRLKPLGNPAVWAPLTVFTLLSIFIWEYHKNPDWFNRGPIGQITPASNLTPEEEARLSEIDNLDVLIDGSRAPSDTEAVTSQIDPGSPIAEEAEGSADDADTSLAARENPFAEYEAEYQFSGTPNPAALSTSGTITPATSPLGNSPTGNEGFGASGNRPAGSSGRFNFGNGLVNADSPNTNSALSQALNRQSAAQAAESDAPNSQNGARPVRPDTSGVQNLPTGGSSAAPSALPPTGNVPTTFIPTTPDMSPPVGTTGYQAPASSSLPTFNTVPPQATTNPFNPQQRATQGQIQTPSIQTAPATTVPQTGTNGTVNTNPSGTSFTPPAFTQPDQGRAINPRR
ncbi:MAG: hypothetical protein AAFO83_10390 [Cyanobacteria bacterium J06607_13]